MQRQASSNHYIEFIYFQNVHLEDILVLFVGYSTPHVVCVCRGGGAAKTLESSGRQSVCVCVCVCAWWEREFMVNVLNSLTPFKLPPGFASKFELLWVQLSDTLTFTSAGRGQSADAANVHLARTNWGRL